MTCEFMRLCNLQMSERVQCIGGIILRRENWSTQRKTCLNVIPPTTDPRWSGLALHPGMCGEKPVTDSL